MFHKEMAKAKTAAKTITYDHHKIKKVVLKTLAEASTLVGSTLGPNGELVLIERQENLGPYMTKDGITVFNSMAYADPTAQAVLEAARDSSSKTNVEAGDGPQPLYSKVLTLAGFIDMGDIEVGMKICGTNGTTQTVLGVYPKGEKEIYEVEFSDGRIVECCADHLWKINTNYGVEKILTVSSMIKDYRNFSEKGNTKYRYYVPNTIVEFNENKAEMPLDPYLVGLLLGDGSLSGTGAIELSLGKKKEHILDKIILPDGIKLNSTFYEDKNYYRVKLTGKTTDGHSMFDLVKSIGLFGTYSSIKFIPRSYLYSSRQSRIQLLQGLLDTDGHINIRDRFEYSTISEELFNDFMTLVRSLGISTFSYLMDRIQDSSYSETPIYKIMELKGYKYGDKIIRISPTGKYTQMQCIKVSNPDSLYITDNFIVTHNTTTATILAESLIRNGFEYLEKNPRLSVQKIMRDLEKTFDNIIEPHIKANAVKVNNTNQKDLLRKVAMISTNNDADMADAVIKCFDLVGTNGNVTIIEASGVSGFAVEKIEGLPIARGFEDSCGRFLEEFINDKSNYRTILEKPKFLLYNGKINDINRLLPILSKVGDASDNLKFGEKAFSSNLVIVAHDFSEEVVAQLAYNFKAPNTINAVPLKCPITYQANSGYHFLQDLASFTGAKVFDPLNNPLPRAELVDLGLDSMKTFEYNRYKSTVIGTPDETLLLLRVSELEQQSKSAESEYDAEILRERLALLTGGLARLKVYGSSEIELKEKRHRVEDAVCSVKSSIKDGVLPGCGKVLNTLSVKIQQNASISDAVRFIMGRAFLEPFKRLLINGGNNSEDINRIFQEMMGIQPSFGQRVKLFLTGNPWKAKSTSYTYDALSHEFGDAIDIGVIDSASAVLYAIKNSLSVAKMLMGMSGIVVFKRDMNLDVEEAQDYHDTTKMLREAEQQQEAQLWQPRF